ncbi:MAG: ATP-binding protein [Actinomycetota bacterium]
MPLKITRASEPIKVEQITVCLYAPPGLGKTATASTAEGPLLLDFDNGAHRTAFRSDAVRVDSWREVARISPQDLEPYRTVVVDTVGRALDYLASELISQDRRNSNRSGGLSLQGYGALKSTFSGWLRQLHVAGKDVVLIAHMDEQKRGDDVLERLDVQGSSKNELYKSADVMGRLAIGNEGGFGGRLLAFSPTDTAFGKDPAGLGTVPVPSFDEQPRFLAELMAGVKDCLNADSAAAQDLARQRAEFRDLPATADAFSTKAAELSDADPAVKRALVEVAEEMGLVFDRQAKAFTGQAGQAEAAA